MKKILGIATLFLVVCAFTAYHSDTFLTPINLENVLRRTALFGIISIGAAFVIITRGIDLSIGSVIALVGTMLPWLLVHHQFSPVMGVATVMGVSLVIGLMHGLLITKLQLQPFIVTLCGLLLYRGMARQLTGDQNQGFGTAYEGLRSLAIGTPFSMPVPGVGSVAIPAPLLILIGVAVLAGVFLNQTVYGRYTSRGQ